MSERDELQAGPPRRPQRRYYSKHVVQPEAILDFDDPAEDAEFVGGARFKRHPERDMPIAGAPPRAEMWADDEESVPRGDGLDESPRVWWRLPFHGG